jgi:hypothetical protein
MSTRKSNARHHRCQKLNRHRRPRRCRSLVKNSLRNGVILCWRELGLPELPPPTLVERLVEEYSPKEFLDLEIVRACNELNPYISGWERFFLVVWSGWSLGQAYVDVRNGLSADLKKPEALVRKFFPEVLQY